MMNYGVDFFGNTKTLIPSLIRNTRVRLYLAMLLEPLQQLNKSFKSYVSAKRYELTWNGQVCMLEQMLRDAFDNGDTRIYISDPDVSVEGTAVIYYKSEDQQPTFIYPNGGGQNPILRYKSEYLASVHFIVFVPSDLYISGILQGMKTLLDKYKIAGKIYEFKEY
jgi:hypothetical protein